MTEFWIFGALLLALALLFVVVPLWRGAARNNAVVRDAANLEIFRDQVAEMDADLANGLLTPELYEQGKRELQARMVEEVQSLEASVPAVRNPLKVLAVALVVLIPLLSVGLYLKVGNPDALSGDMQAMLSGDALAELQQKLDAKPENPQGWLQAARSYYALGQYPQAVKAYDKLTQLVPDEAMLWTEYADAVGMAQNKSLVGRPAQLLDKALAIDPNYANALALAGTAAMERGDYPAAVKYWQSLYDQIPDKNSDAAKQVGQGLSMAKDFLAKTGGKLPAEKRSASSGKERITGTVALSPAVKAKADPQDTVYVLARAENGSPMPLAVIKSYVKDLPLHFSMDDSNAVMPRAKLSDASKVVLIARVSKSGDPMPQTGDLQGASGAIKPGAHGVKISINSVVK
ncbi:MAG TPA: c-type cytochrome biogenesis protein CcmI [Gallionellaceae bacterium]|nr:c-type cytochrome biogenesis protein CcmI [Gallionellaceae bacterium]